MTSYADQLRANGLRVTRPRLAVLDELARGGHLDTDTVVRRVRTGAGAVSTQAVYDILRALKDAGMIRTIEPAGSPALHEIRQGDNHHHLVCRDCGLVVDVDCAVGTAPCLEPSATQGFTLDEAEVTFWGRCATCASPGTSPDSRTSAVSTTHQGSTRND